jgi:hypothetical protein
MADPSPSAPVKPIDVVDGIPNRSPNRPLWKYLLVAVGFLAWLGVLAMLYGLGGR